MALPSMSGRNGTSKCRKENHLNLMKMSKAKMMIDELFNHIYDKNHQNNGRYILIFIVLRRVEVLFLGLVGSYYVYLYLFFLRIKKLDPNVLANFSLSGSDFRYDGNGSKD